MLDAGAFEQIAALFEELGDDRIGGLEEHIGETHGLELRHRVAVQIDRKERRQAVFAAHIQVAVGRCDVHDAGAVVERHEVVADDAVAGAQVGFVAGSGDAVEEARVARTGQLATGVGRKDGVVFAKHSGGQAGCQDDALAGIVGTAFGQDVVGVGIDGQGDVGRQGPGRGCPGEEGGAGQGCVEGMAARIEPEAQPDRWVVDVVLVALIDFGVGQGGATTRAVHGDFVIAEEQITVPELA